MPIYALFFTLNLIMKNTSSFLFIYVFVAAMSACSHSTNAFFPNNAVPAHTYAAPQPTAKAYRPNPHLQLAPVGARVGAYFVQFTISVILCSILSHFTGLWFFTLPAFFIDGSGIFKSLMGLKIVDKSGKEASKIQIWGRAFLKFNPFLPFFLIHPLIMLPVFFTEKSQSLADFFSGTVVVDKPRDRQAYVMQQVPRA